MNSSLASHTTFHSQMENPLIWPIFEVLKGSYSSWKVHILAARLNELGYIHQLDANAEKDVFKRNFLIMNALYQLQETLYPDKWLQVESMNIMLYPRQSTLDPQQYAIDVEDPLRDYYTNWLNYEATEGEVKRLLNQFWQRYRDYVGNSDVVLDMDRAKALSLFKLPVDAEASEIRRRWRRLAMRWHPDRENGDAARFRILCEAWNVLRREHHYPV
jgi:hypothetical protein